MPKVIEMSDGSTETIIRTRDFLDLIEAHMGIDSAAHYNNQIEELSDCIRDLAKYIDDKDVQAEVEEVLKVHGYE